MNKIRIIGSFLIVVIIGASQIFINQDIGILKDPLFLVLTICFLIIWNMVVFYLQELERVRKMSEWIKLDPYDMPKDIFDNDKYEYHDESGNKILRIISIEIYDRSNKFIMTKCNHTIEVQDLNGITDEQGIFESFSMHYREKQIQRTHQEIMTNWFKQGDIWGKAERYDCVSEECAKYFYRGNWCPKEHFNDLTMADIPPEDEK